MCETRSIYRIVEIYISHTIRMRVASAVINYANLVRRKIRSRRSIVCEISAIAPRRDGIHQTGRERCNLFDPLSVCCSCVRRRRGCGVPSTRHGALRYVRIIQHAYTVIQFTHYQPPARSRARSRDFRVDILDILDPRRRRLDGWVNQRVVSTGELNVIPRNRTPRFFRELSFEYNYLSNPKLYE